MAKTKYHITLTESERETLLRIISEGDVSPRLIMRARILLESDSSTADKISVVLLADKLETTSTTIQTVRTEYAKGGLEYALYRKQREQTHYNSKISDRVTRYILELSKSEPPKGHNKWSCKSLADQAMADQVVESISAASVLRILQSEESTESAIRRRKKTNQ